MKKIYNKIRNKVVAALTILALPLGGVGEGLLLTGCTDDNIPARTPEAQVTVSKTQLVINESMEIHFTGVADQVVVYTGDAGHDYYEDGTYDDPDGTHPNLREGLVMNKGLLTYSYSTPGTFRVVVVASCYDTFMGGGMKEDKYEYEVKVYDDCTTIEQLYVSTQVNVFYANAVDEDNWLMLLPTKQVYNNKEVALNAAKQRVVLSIPSTATTVQFDGEDYSPTAYRDLTKVHDIVLTSDAGTSRSYKLTTLIYPEFTTLTSAGTAAKLTRNSYYQDLLTYAISTVDGKAELSFTLPDDVVFCANGKELASGTTINVNDATTNYTLVRSFTAPNGKVLTAVSRVVFVSL